MKANARRYCGAKILFAPQKDRVKALSEAGLYTVLFFHSVD